MAKTLTTERNLKARQTALARDLRLLQRMRGMEWGAALLLLAVGVFWKPALIVGSILAILAVGHEIRRREQQQDLVETESVREAKGAFARLLDEKLANDHYVLNDLRLKVGREKCWIDHLVVGPFGMFVINTYNWPGRITGDASRKAYSWTIREPGGRTRPVRNPAAKVQRERRILCNWLKGTALIWENVYPLVVLANPEAEIRLASAERRVMTPEKAIDYINGFCFEKPVLSNAEVERLALGLFEHANVE